MTTPSHVPPPPADFRSRYSRPKEGRKLAGVCAALGRATNTDPVLWRVVFAVFALFGGAGLVAYAAGWLFLSEDGDTASPIEALLGRGQSSTPAFVTILVAIGSVIGAIVVADTNFEFAAMLALIVVGVVLLVNKRPSGAPTGVPGGPPAFGPPATPAPVAYYMPAQATQNPAGPPVAPPAGSVPFAPHGPYQPAGNVPFAPHGPYQPAWIPPQVPPRLPKPPKRPKEKSILSRLTLFAVLIGLGVLGILDATGWGVSVASYFGVALGIVGAGLVVGTFLGRGYKLIALGLVLAFGLAVSASATEVRKSVVRDGGQRTWIPQSVGVIDPEYSIRVGLGTLDLRAVDFTDRTVTVAVSTEAGEMRVLLPSKVDVEVRPNVSNGEATILGTHVAPEGQQSTITDLGIDGAGGGKLIINLNVKFGTARVTR
ncbi:PspC domain-containing protein [Longispora urticae]